jgi:ribonuclease E
MVLESNRDLVLRRLVECLSRDRTKHQVAEVTSLGLVQMTRKKLGLGLLESFSETCDVCAGRGLIVHHDPVFKHRGQQAEPQQGSSRGRRGRGGNGGGGGGGGNQQAASAPKTTTHEITDDVRNALAKIAAKTVHQEVSSDAPSEAAPEQIADAVAAAPVEILDIPIEPVRVEKARPVVDPDAVLGSVLDALPEPKKPGQGRGRRSRRASSAAGSPDAG